MNSTSTIARTETPKWDKPFKPIRNQYFGLRTRLLILLLVSGKLSWLKIWNALYCYAAYFLRRIVTGVSPLVITFELWNECNESCVFCRSDDNGIYDTNPNGNGQPIPKGKMEFDVYKTILERTADRLLLAVPYINGEPLMSRDIFPAIELATNLKIGSLIASNGVLLSSQNSRKLIEAGLDCLKVHISGFTQPVHSIEHRRGNVDVIKKNILEFVRLKKEMKAKTIVVLDYILYQHNKHELPLARRFAQEHGLVLNIRPGNPKGMEDREPPQSSGPPPSDLACDLLWTVLSIDWDGAIYPCCDHVVWSGAHRHGTVGSDDILAAWNGPSAKRMRSVHAREGRRPIPICSNCPRQGVKFKW